MLTFSSDGKWLLAQSDDRLYLLSVESGNIIDLKMRLSENNVRKAVISNNNWLVIDKNNKLLLWNLNQISENPLTLKSDSRRQ